MKFLSTLNLLLVSTLSSICLFSSCTGDDVQEKSYNRGINIIPAPKELSQQDGYFKLTQKTAFFAPSMEAKIIANFFGSKIKTATGIDVSFKQEASSNTISLTLDSSLDVNEEGYTLDVNPKEIKLKAKTPQGLFYGMQTLMQLLPAEIESPSLVTDVLWRIPSVTIKDEPRFEYRGVHLDPCRHFISVENIKKQLDVMALFKLNRMHWHLTDDQGWRIEIKKYPRLTQVGSRRIEGEGFEYSGYYTQAEIKDIVHYAAERFITVIPEIELPGHALAAISAYPELSCTGQPVTPRIIWGVEDIVLCAGKEETFEFLEDVIAEVVELFPGEYLHIGGDESPKDNWKKCPRCQARIRKEGLRADSEHTAEEKLQSYFVQRIGEVVAQHGKKMIGWDEILEGGLAPSAIVMSWRGEQGGIAAANMNHEVIMTPGTNGLYLDHFQGDAKIEPVTIGGYTLLEKTYSYNPTPDTLVQTGKDHLIKGVQGNNWSEYMYTNGLMEYRMYPRVLAVAEVGWTPLNRKDYKDFERRLDNAYVRLDGHRINYHIPQPEQPYGSCNFVAFTDRASLTFKTTRPIKMVYTTDESEPTPESTVYNRGPIDFTGSAILKIRSVLPSGKMSPTRTITVQKQELSSAVRLDNPMPGLKMEVTYGHFLNTTNFYQSQEWKSAVIKDLREITQVEKTDESMRGVKQYGAVATGYVNIPEDGVYYVSSDNEEVWIDSKLLINNKDEVKRFSRNDKSVALKRGLHEFKVVFLGHIIGGWPSNWNNGGVLLRKEGTEQFTPITPDMLVYQK